MRRPTPRTLPLLVLVALGLTFGLGCAGLALSPGLTFAYFEAPPPHDPWSPKIAGWQRREKAEPLDLLAALPPVAEPAAPLASYARVAFPSPASIAPVSPLPDPSEDSLVSAEMMGANGSSLRAKYTSFLAERKRALAREFAAWIQSQAKQHYVSDGPIDHWATLEETLRSGGDDCDGLELLTFRGLRELGFRDSEVFRAIVYRPSDGQHHMVTLWFEVPDDPWVIDPTGAMTTGMPRMSELTRWVPLKVFDETVDYTVRRGPSSRLPADLAANR